MVGRIAMIVVALGAAGAGLVGQLSATTVFASGLQADPVTVGPTPVRSPSPSFVCCLPSNGIAVNPPLLPSPPPPPINPPPPPPTTIPTLVPPTPQTMPNMMPNPFVYATLAPLPPPARVPVTPSPSVTPEPAGDGLLREDPSARGGPRPPGQVGQQVADLAVTFVGRPYTWAGASPETGFDCSGLVYYVYSQFGFQLARDSFSQWTNGRQVPKTDLLPGDVVFFEDTYTEGMSHNGVYLGGGRFIHAVEEGVGVKINLLTDDYWTPRFAGARRILP